MPAWLLVVAALVLALVGQAVLTGWPAVAAYGLAALFFYRATRVGATEATSGRLDRTTLLAGYGLLVAIALGLIVKQADPPSTFPAWGLAFAAWLSAIVCYTRAWAYPLDFRRSLAHVWRTHRVEIGLIVLILSAALILRTVALDHFPRAFGGDDAQGALNARAVLEGGTTSPFGMSGIALGQFPSLYFIGQAAAMRAFGDDVAGARMLSALLGTAGVAALYLFGRQAFGCRVGLTAAALLAAFPYHLFWSRNPLNNIWDPLAVVVVLLVTTRALSSRQPAQFALAGLMLGFAQYGYMSARLLFAIVPLLVVREWLADRTWLSRNWRELLIMAGGLVVAFLPQAVYFAAHPADFYGRFGQVSIFQSGWIAAEVANTGQSWLAVLAEQVRRVLLVFHAVPPRGFFETGRPLLDPLSGVLFLFGLVAAAVNIRNRHAFALLVTMLAFLLSVALTENAPSATRLVAVGPLAILLVALGLIRAVEVIPSGLPLLPPLIAGIVVSIVATLGVHFYFVQYPAGPNYDYPFGAAATEFAYYMQEFPPGTRFVFLAQPWMSCNSHATLRFIAPRHECTDVPPPVPGTPPPLLKPDDVVVALPGRRAEAEHLVVSLGQVTVREFRLANVREPLLIAFEPTRVRQVLPQATHGR